MIAIYSGGREGDTRRDAGPRAIKSFTRQALATLSSRHARLDIHPNAFIKKFNLEHNNSQNLTETP